GGRSVILITHKLREVLNLAQRITVLRQGRVVAVTEAAQATPDALARLMVGAVPAPAVRADRAAAAVPLLEVRDLRLRDRRGAAALRGLSLSVHAGEMVGVAGVDGNGQRELVDALLGLAPAQGSIRLRGAEVIGTAPGERRRLGLAVIPADRNVDGVCRGASISENLVATCFGRPPYSLAGLLPTCTIAGQARRVIDRLRLRAAR